MVEVLRNRPLLVFSVALVIGLSLREYSWNIVFIPILGFLLRDSRSLITLSVAGLLGLFLSPDVPSKGVERTQYMKSSAYVASVPRLFPDGMSYVLEVQGKRLAVSEDKSVDRSLGDRLLIEGMAKPLREGSESNQLAKGIVGRFEPIRVRVISPGPSLYRSASLIRSSFVAFTQRSMSPESAAILDALCFNIEGGLSEDFSQNLSTTGTIHIISASGLHVMVIAFAVNGLLGLFPIPRSLRLGLLGMLLLFYAAAAGMQPAIIRSVLMAMLSLSAYLWRREADLLSALALSAIVYLVWQPLGIYNLGFQFSFLTVGAFALFGTLRESFSTTAQGFLKDFFADNLRTTGIAYLSTIPILVFYFGSFSLVAIPTNLIIFPAVSFLLIGGLATFGVDLILPGIGQAFAKFLLEPFIGFLQSCVNMFGSLTISSIPSPYFHGYWLVLFYLVAIGLFVKERVRPA